MNTVDGYAMSSWESGYGDFVMRPDLSTLRRVPWHEGTVLLMCDLARRRRARRSWLRRATSCGRRPTGWQARGWQAMVGTELEFMRVPRHLRGRVLAAGTST